MTKRQFIVLLGLVGQAGCVIYDEAIQREASDAAVDVPRDVVLPRSRDGAEEKRSDAAAVDAGVTRDAAADRGASDDAILTDASDVSRADVAIDAGDALAPTSDAPIGDATTDDATIGDTMSEPSGDRIVAVDASDVTNEDMRVVDVPSSDTSSDPPIIGCTVDFTVSGVTWEEGGVAEEGGVRVVRIVGDIAALGAWAPEAGRAMTEKAPGAWSVSLAMPDKTGLEFKFVKMQAGRAAQWEQWLPLDSNRSLLVDCAAEGGPKWIDAGTDAGAILRAVGRSYGGAFGVRPLDATK